MPALSALVSAAFNLKFFQAQSQMVIEAMKYLDEIADRDEKVKLITTLRTVTDGKVLRSTETFTPSD